MSKLKTPLRYEAGIIFDAEGEKICNFGISTFAHCDDWGHAHQIIDAVNNQPSPSPIEAGGHTPGDSGLKLPLRYDKSTRKIYEADGSELADLNDKDTPAAVIDRCGEYLAYAPNLRFLLAAWIMRAWHFGADVDPGLLEWARVNEDGSTQLNHLTLEAVKGGGR